MTFGKDDDQNAYSQDGTAYVPDATGTVEVKPLEPKKPHRKVSWVTALVTGLVVVFVVAVLLLAVLFTNYRRGAKLSKVMHGAERVEVNIYTTEDVMRANGGDLFESQDRVQQVISEMGVSKDEVVVKIVLTDRPVESTTTQEEVDQEEEQAP
jgi:hypothetical protein